MLKRAMDFFKSNLRQLLQIVLFAFACGLPWIIDFNSLFEPWLSNTDTSPDNVLWHLALSYGRPALAVLFVFLLLSGVRKWNAEYVMNKDSNYHDYAYIWYWFCSKVLGIKKCNLILVPISMQFKLILRGTFPEYPLEPDDYPVVQDELDCKITTENKDAGNYEINLLIEDTYEISDFQIPKEKRNNQTIKVSRYNGTNIRHFSQKLIDAVNGVVHQKKRIPRLNVFATTNPMNSKHLASSVFAQGGRGNISHLYVFQQQASGRRIFEPKGRKIY